MGRAIVNPVKLTPAERDQLGSLLKAGRHPARLLTRARILLLTDCGTRGPAWPDPRICEAVGVTLRTLSRVRAMFARERVVSIRHHAPVRYRPRRLDGRAEAQLITLACSAPPAGRTRWTLRLLAEKLVCLDIVEEVSHETIRATLKKTNLSLG